MENELRRNPLLGNWMITGDKIGKIHNHNYIYDLCPFCPERANKEKEITRYPYGGINNENWDIKVVPNKYPLLGTDGCLNRRAEGMFDRMNAIGANEVVIETPHHKDKFANFSLEKIETVLKMWQWRIEDLKKDSQLRFIFIYKNEGGSIHIGHSHSQVIATPFNPEKLRKRLKEMEKYAEMKDRCILCDVLKQELKNKNRLVEENENYAVITPFASRWPFEMQIIPKAHNCSFETEKSSIKDLTIIMRNTIKRLEKILDLECDPLSYTLCLNTSPNENSNVFFERQKEIELFYHWDIEIIPNIGKKISNFEEITEIRTNPIKPEDAAKKLREAKI